MCMWMLWPSAPSPISAPLFSNDMSCCHPYPNPHPTLIFTLTLMRTLSLAMETQEARGVTAPVQAERVCAPLAGRMLGPWGVKHNSRLLM